MIGVSRHTVAITGDIGNHCLIQDSMPLKVVTAPSRTILEDAHGNKHRVLTLSGQFQYANRPNANGRIYGGDVLSHAVKEIQEDIQSRRVIGEFDHPPDAKIHLDRVSHLITKLWMENDAVFGELQVLEKTPMGNILKALIESNVQIGISSRGVGDMESIIHEGRECYRVLPGYTLVTFDIVAEPSVEGSFLSVMESRDRLAGMQVKNLKHERERELIREFRNTLNQNILLS